MNFQNEKLKTRDDQVNKKTNKPKVGIEGNHSDHNAVVRLEGYQRPHRVQHAVVRLEGYQRSHRVQAFNLL